MGACPQARPHLKSAVALLALGLALLAAATATGASAATILVNAPPAVAAEAFVPCEEDACQPLPSPPEDPTPGTLVPSEGNPPVHFPKEKHKPHPEHKPSKGKRHSAHSKGGKHR
jgi:hypothetical protein